MKIPPFNLAAAAADAGRRSTSGVLAARWRWALEQAQWRQAGERPAPASASRSTPSFATAANDHSHRPAVLAGSDVDPAAKKTVEPGQPMEGPVATTATAAGATLPLDVGAESSVTLPPAAAIFAMILGGSTAGEQGAETMPTASAPPLREPLDPWPLFNVQAHVEGRAVSAAVRDSRLDASDADELERRLASQLAADGLELVELRVNGHLAGADDRPPAEP